MIVHFKDGFYVHTFENRLMFVGANGIVDVGFRIQDLIDKLEPNSVMLSCDNYRLLLWDKYSTLAFDPSTQTWEKLVPVEGKSHN